MSSNLYPKKIIDSVESLEPDDLMNDDGVLNELGEALISVGLNTLRHAAHRQAEKSGWNTNRNTPIEELALVVTEVAEAIDELRDGNPGVQGLYFDAESGKPEGLSSEIGDVFIRLGHFASHPEIEASGGVDIVEGTLAKLRFNPTRAYRHGGRLA